MDPWRELEEIEEIEQEFYTELMEEPPHGHNHGRKRTEAGGWQPLETNPADAPSYKRTIDSPRTHGTNYTYNKIGCRCDVCKAWRREAQRKQRHKASG